MPRALDFLYRGYNFGFSAFLNGQFLGSGQGRAAIDPSGRLVLVNATFTFPDHVVKEENVVSVVVDNMGLEQDWCSDDAFKVGHLTSYGISLTEKIGSPRDSWNSTGCSPSAGITLDRAGTTAYKTKLMLDIDKHADVPLAFRFERTLGKSYRVMVYVNEWQFGKFVSNFGPQTVYPVPEGISDRRGENDVVLVLWSLDGAGANVANVELIATNVLFSSKEVINGLVN
ncbi:Beta-galactosidase, domain 3, partial [Rhizoctonia solani]